MFFSSIFYLLIFINFFGSNFVKLEPINQTNSLTEIEEKIKSWIPLENSEIVKFYFFNITDLDDYFNNENGKITVEELEILKGKSLPLKPYFSSLSSDGSFARFNLDQKYFFNNSEKEKLYLNKTILQVNKEFSRILDDSTNGFIDSPKNKTRSLFKNEIIVNINVAKDIVPESFTYEIATGRNNPNLEGEDVGFRETIEGKCIQENLPSVFKNVKDIRLQFLRRKPLDVNNSSKLRLMFHYRPVTFAFNRAYIFKGVNVSRFEIDESGMSMKNENKFFCDNTKKIDGISLCEMTGVLDTEICSPTPISIHSNAHFLDASTVIQNHIKGLMPDPLKHKSYVDIDSDTGVILNYRLSMQINAYLRVSKLGFKKDDLLIPYLRAEFFNERSDEFMDRYKKQKLNLT